ncbi:MAG: bifunctional 3-(3-hydroxy-phenyl)propionate/3-hydroxycinnamic acid hydroxylase [Thermomicrobiales bacterium]
MPPVNSESASPNDPTQPAMPRRVDVAVIGAGPVSLTIANFLGMYGVSVLVIERGAELIDYPRGVGMDDECLRAFQAIGLADNVRPHTTPDQWVRFLTARGRCFASVEPRTREFGWPRRNAFIQPLVDLELLKGLSRYQDVHVLFGRSLSELTEIGDGVSLRIQDGAGATEEVHASFVVGADGGKSTVRKILNIPFSGKTESTRWVVVDIRNDPIGIPDAYLYCIPTRPYVSIALPHGIRRVEFMVFGEETEEQLCSRDGIQNLLQIVMPHPEKADIIRSRVYTHHARLAERFRQGRVLLAGDAAHLMPVWQGQGYNSGIRDATNIAWKLAMVVKGMTSDTLLDSYDLERRDHAAAMISISVTAGKIFSPTQRWLAMLRDGLTLLLNAIPPVKNYILQMRFKPMPRYTRGVVVPLATSRGTAPSPVGRLFIQPDVALDRREIRKFDDAIGPWFAIVAWATDPRLHMSDTVRAFWQNIGARFVAVLPAVQLSAEQTVKSDDLLILGDTGAIKQWFGDHRTSLIVLRPDRFVAAAASTPQAIDEITASLQTAMGASIQGQ